MKFYGYIGFSDLKEDPPGYFSEVVIERPYTGDFIKSGKRYDTADQLNDEIKLNDRISILADIFTMDHLYAFRYVKWNGTAWKVTSFDVDYPRIIISVGGVYNGPQPGVTENS